MTSSIKKIPFNIPFMTGRELDYIVESKELGQLAGDGTFTKKCHSWLESYSQCTKALLTHSCTAALEMSAILLNLEAGDEVIMPSYTFVSTANAFVLRGAVPVFVDIRPDTLNIDEKLIENAITSKTKAIVVVHYAGVGCEMNIIMDIAKKHDLNVVEDAAQGVLSKYEGKPLGSFGDLAAFSFHETKNIISGEGGALIVNKPDLVLRAEIIREKGTDRSSFFRNEVDKYTWQDKGSSFLPGEIIAAFLMAQLEDAYEITRQRMDIWDRYHALIEPMEKQRLLSRPHVPKNCEHNAHMYYILLPQNVCRQNVLSSLKDQGIGVVFHYIPLHSSPAGIKYGRSNGELCNTDMLSERLVRLPLWIGMTDIQQKFIVDALEKAILNELS
ncbi:dTDP-4-amino-4,6-dideoxygalactose transaminase [Enterovibrio sp. ZSDZ42]|uniref:dTDP-4-amino-4,6-dideoxygalactose transaminase n=1 Tax=Enterovibrio gelatinilyticus TaxID=2899819 RepID=A0ABT5QWH7_9GAMM|nr:dTDP-4-amino-4,6-dideoxygalactose transaminase [Enterovibrio sp. ZSDZ42]MDD1792373.1 dTDP-4-amino-4,6-dideoxygalactose transaminase [Enterovibrio sp. ZSDZ42]